MHNCECNIIENRDDFFKVLINISFAALKCILSYMFRLSEDILRLLKLYKERMYNCVCIIIKNGDDGLSSAD